MTNALAAFLNVAICSGVVAFAPAGQLCVFNDMDEVEGDLILLGQTMDGGERCHMMASQLVEFNPTYAM